MLRVRNGRAALRTDALFSSAHFAQPAPCAPHPQWRFSPIERIGTGMVRDGTK
jgi:hypothetical protein